MRELLAAMVCAPTLVLGACASTPSTPASEAGFDPDADLPADFAWCANLWANQGKDFAASPAEALSRYTGGGDGKLYAVDLDGLEGRVQVARSKTHGPALVIQDDEGRWTALPFTAHTQEDASCAQEGLVEVMAKGGVVVALWTVPAFGAADAGCNQSEMQRQFTLVADVARGVSLFLVDCDPGAGVEYPFDGNVVLVGCSEALDGTYAVDRLARCPTI